MVERTPRRELVTGSCELFVIKYVYYLTACRVTMFINMRRNIGGQLVDIPVSTLSV